VCLCGDNPILKKAEASLIYCLKFQFNPGQNLNPV